MGVLLVTILVLFGQGYDDTGGASRTSIIIGALAFPCLIIIAVVWQRLKNAKENEKQIENLQKKVAELERVSVPKDLQTRYGLSLRDAQEIVRQFKSGMAQIEVLSRLGKPDETSSGPLSDGFDGIVSYYRWQVGPNSSPKKKLTIVFQKDSNNYVLNHWYFD